MKLSDVKGERTFEVIADIIGPISTIAADEDAMRLFNTGDKPDDMTNWQWFIERARTSVPVLMRNYSDEFCQIMSAIEGTDKDEYKEGLSIPKLLSDVISLVTDSELVTFFS
jgi:hypothetical protein